MVKRQWLADIRTNQGRTQQEIASVIGTSQSGYANIEAGIRAPSVEVAKKIAAVLGFDWTRFFEEPTADPVEDTA